MSDFRSCMIMVKSAFPRQHPRGKPVFRPVGARSVIFRTGPVLPGRNADHIPEGSGEFAGIVIAKLTGDVQHRPVGFPQQRPPRRASCCERV